MPELPDVEVYLSCLEPRLLGEPLERVRLASPFVLRTVEQREQLVTAEPDGLGQLVQRRRPEGPLFTGREDLVEPLLLLGRERLQPLEEQDLSLATGLHPAGVLQPREHELDQLLGERPGRADRGALDRGRRGTPRQDLVDAGQQLLLPVHDLPRQEHAHAPVVELGLLDV